MRKRARPHRHYRNIKTRKGRKRILINPSIKKKARKVKRRGWFPKKDKKLFESDAANKMSYEEYLRRLNQQVEMNVMKDIEEYQKAKKDFEDAAREKEKKNTLGAFEDLDKKRRMLAEKQEQIREEKEMAQAAYPATKKIGEFGRLLGQLQRKRKDSTKVEFVEQLYGENGKNMYDKLADAEKLARKSGRQDLIDQVDELKDEFNAFISEPKTRELIKDLSERNAEGKLKPSEKVGFQMLTMPEVKGSKTKFVRTTERNLGDYKDWNDFKKDNPDVILIPPTKKQAEAAFNKLIKDEEAKLKRYEQEEEEARRIQRDLPRQKDEVRGLIAQNLQRRKKEIAYSRGISLDLMKNLRSEIDKLKQAKSELEDGEE